MPRVFVCHRREDTADVAGRIFDRLVMNYGGQQILKDLDSIPLGVDFREYLGRMVGECDVLLAVIGPRWLGAQGDKSRLEDPRDFVRIEIESALAREIPVVPLFVGGASMPLEEDVPESIRPFVYRNGLPVRPDPDFHRDMDRIVAWLDDDGRPAPPAETVVSGRSEPKPPPPHLTAPDALLERFAGEPTELVKAAEHLIEEHGAPPDDPLLGCAEPPAGPFRRGSDKRSDAAASDIETPQHDAGMVEIRTPPTGEQAPTILIVAEDEVQTVRNQPGFETNIHVFADSDSIKALQCISRDRPRVVVLGHAFVGSLRGAALVNAIKTDRTLANTQIRVISQASDYPGLVRQADPQVPPNDAMPGEPLPPDYLGTRGARRYKMRADLKVRVDGNPTTVVDLSRTGARLVGTTALRVKQRVSLVLGTEPEVVRCSGSVVWVWFEPRTDGVPRYTVGARLIDGKPEAIQDLARRHLQH